MYQAPASVAIVVTHLLHLFNLFRHVILIDTRYVNPKIFVPEQLHRCSYFLEFSSESGTGPVSRTSCRVPFNSPTPPCMRYSGVRAYHALSDLHDRQVLNTHQALWIDRFTLVPSFKNRIRFVPVLQRPKGTADNTPLGFDMTPRIEPASGFVDRLLAGLTVTS